MKKIFALAALVLALSSAKAQTSFTKDASGNKIGFTKKEDWSAEPAYPWFAENQKGYTPEAAALQALKAKKDSIHIVTFGGTWCGDTRFVVPKLLALTDAAGFSPERLTLIGVDESKKTVHHLAETFNVTLVPTIIVFKNGKEVGRVVEYGKYGLFDKELGEIIARN
jgi:thiol-disulfide isomerase/thioredoxin